MSIENTFCVGFRGKKQGTTAAVTGFAVSCRGVMGPLVDLFDCSESLYSAVEVTAGGSLFHVVVDTDATASQIMRHLTAQRVGRITCLPLNKLNVRLPLFVSSK